MVFRKLDHTFYTRNDILNLSCELLGKHLVTQIDGKKTAGKIVETEAYLGPEDKASHAYNNRKTDRTSVMFESGGLGYVYLCYGIHHLFNVVTGQAGIPHAILIRGVEPVEGEAIMLNRRKMTRTEPRLTAGPGCLTAALGIRKNHSGVSLTGNEIWIEDRGEKIIADQIIRSPRVGIDYAEEYIAKPWRFRVKGSPWASPAR